MPKYLTYVLNSKSLRSMDFMDGFENHIEPNRIWGTDTATCRLDAAAVWIYGCVPSRFLAPFVAVILFFFVFGLATTLFIVSRL